MIDENSLERAAEAYASRRFSELRGITPDEFTWKDSQYGRELLMMFQAYLSGAQSQQSATQPEEWAKVKWATVIKAEGSIGKSYSPHDAAMLGAQRGFDAALDLIAHPLLKQNQELEAQLAEAKESAKLGYEMLNARECDSESDRAAMREALEALEKVITARKQRNIKTLLS